MSKLILFFLLAFAAYLFYKVSRRTGSAQRSKEAQKAAERMVVCAHCGVHLPESESLQDAGGNFCCEEHRRLGAA